MKYIAAGANRHPNAGDWSEEDGRGGDGRGGVLAYGSGSNVACWGVGENGRGVETLLVGHSDTVNAVKFLSTSQGLLLLTGSVDKSIRIWCQRKNTSTTPASSTDFHCVQVLNEHQSSVNCIAATAGVEILATGSADATVKIWKIDTSGKEPTVELLQSIKVEPRFFPLALALSLLRGTSNSYVLAVAGTAAIVQLYIAESISGADPEFKLQATLSGHEGWIRSLSFKYENGSPGSDLLLSSASQDKYIRLWRIHRGKELPAAVTASSNPALGAFLPGKSLSNKAHRFVAEGEDYSATFEALLLGHEDWIYSAIWRPGEKTLQLLSASADNSLTIWEQDPTSSVWVSIARLGEISAQKGSTTATGSTGGFWTGLWSPSGSTVACLGRTGSWRTWNYSSTEDRWTQGIGIGGHTQSVTGISWSRHGDYLLSTSSDQTTRLHAQWKRNGMSTWHEMARAQIHGYDLNCIDTLADSQFVSGADEKLLRVFQEPKAVATLLQNLSGIAVPQAQDLPDAANMPVLGLSNKAVDAVDAEDLANSTTGPANTDTTSYASPLLSIAHPPLEPHLSRSTLFPEVEKLYGHGYEISTLACSYSGTLVATACKASSVEHAVIRIYETSGWREAKPPLMAHALTVTRLRFSSDDRYLLSVGRDRTWVLWEAQGMGMGDMTYVERERNAKAHSRMILDAAWLPSSQDGAGNGSKVFATAGRDKVVKLWRMAEVEAGEGPEQGNGEEEGKTVLNKGVVCVHTIAEESPVTALDFTGRIRPDGNVSLAVGTESGRLLVYSMQVLDLTVLGKYVMDASASPSRAITQLSWRPFGRRHGPLANGSRMGELPGSRDVEIDTKAEAEAEVGVEVEVEGEVEAETELELELAVASEDCSLRIYALKSMLLVSASTSPAFTGGDAAGVC